MKGRRPLILATALVAILAVPCMAAKTAFRISAMYWRDPHLFVNFIGCRDVTDTQLGGFSFNSSLNNSITTDADADGRLDTNYLLVFDPLDQNAASGPFAFITGGCTAPLAGTSCWPLSSAAATYTNMGTTCLGTVAGTTHGYVPAITACAPPCFVASMGALTLNLNGILVPLHDAFVGATYSGSPATTLVNGLLRGFLTQADADNTVIPATFALVGGQVLSSILPGGTNCCASYSDKDLDNGVPGWYVYFNFVAAQVPLTDPPTAVSDATPPLILETPHPNPFNPATEIRYLLPASARVEVVIYDANGRIVRALANETQSRGDHALRWDGRDGHGAVVSSGVYFVRLSANGESRTQKMVLLK